MMDTVNLRTKRGRSELMNKNGLKSCLIIFVICLVALVSISARAQDTYPASTPLFTDQELDDILAPIALYPDPLLAQVLPASTYPDEILDAYDWLNGGGSVSEIEWQGWDESVKAVAHYPDVLQMMAEYSDWTANLGDAFINQPEDVTRSIQRLRWQARDMGNLVSDNRQTIVVVGDYIEIIPAQPQYIYVPSYDPSVVYYERYYVGGAPFITFSVGLIIGSWLTMDFDWGHHHVIYHGWNRPGWVDRARPHVHVKNFYVQRTRPFINRQWTHDKTHGDPDRFRASHSNVAPGPGRQSRVDEIRGNSGRPLPFPKGNTGKRQPLTIPLGGGKKPGDRQKPGGQTIDITKQPEPPALDTGRQQPQKTIGFTKRPQTSSSFTGGATVQTPSAPEVSQKTKTPSVTFGGYRGASEARGESRRGQASRQSIERTRTFQAPAAKSSPPERKQREDKGGGPEKKGRSGDDGRGGDKQDTKDRPRR
jgi:hypothetical protein